MSKEIKISFEELFSDDLEVLEQHNIIRKTKSKANSGDNLRIGLKLH